MKRTLLVIALLLICLIPIPAKAVTGITDVYLVGPGGTGGTITTSSTVGTSPIIGTTAGAAVTWDAQSFKIAAGNLNQISLPFGATTGAPAGTVTYQVTDNNNSIPGTVLTSGTFTPTASATNVINVSAANLFLSADTTYWILLKATTVQANGVFWTIRADTASSYTDGNRASATDGTGTLWTIFTSGDILMTLDTTASSSAPNLNDKLAQSFTVSQSTVISAVSLNLKKVGSPTGTLTLSLESDAGQMPSGTVAITGASVTVAESTLTTSYAQTVFTFASPITLRPGVLYWLDLTTNRVDATKYVVWGATGVCTGQYFRNHVNGAWQLEQYIGTFALTIDSLSPAQASEDFVTLTSGAVGTVDYSITGGEAALFGLGIILLIVSLFGVYQLTQVKK